MSQLHFYVSDAVEKTLRARAKQANLTLSRYLAELVKQQASEPGDWPDGYFETVFGQWQGERLKRPDQGEFEERASID